MIFIYVDFDIFKKQFVFSIVYLKTTPPCAYAQSYVYINPDLGAIQFTPHSPFLKLGVLNKIYTQFNLIFNILI